MSYPHAKRNFQVLIKAGIPYTIGGMVVVFAGLYLLKHFFAESKYLTIILFAWLAVFWAVYQPLFRKQIQRAASGVKKE